MKKLCLFAFAMSLAIFAPGQVKKGRIYLENGTILKGKIIPTNDPQKIKIESAGNTWVFNASEVDSVAVSNPLPKIQEERASASRFSNFTELGLLVGSSENSQNAPFSFGSFLNYNLGNRFVAGVGAGVVFLKETYVPVMVCFQYKYRNSRSTPYLYFEGGYQVPVEDSGRLGYDVITIKRAPDDYWPYPYQTNSKMDAQGGILLNPGFGYMHMVSSSFGFSFSFGYHFSRLNYSGEKDYELDAKFNRLAVKLGILFN